MPTEEEMGKGGEAPKLPNVDCCLRHGAILLLNDTLGLELQKLSIALLEKKFLRGCTML